MNEPADLSLRDFMDADEGWGRAAGRQVGPRLVEFVERNPGTLVFRVSLARVRRVDISFASETVVEVARRFRGRKGFCLVDLADPDMRENWDAAAARASQPLILRERGSWSVLGPRPKEGLIAAFEFAMARPATRAAEYSMAIPGMAITNASNKFKQLWEQGYLLRRETGSESGGIEFVYYPIC